MLLGRSLSDDATLTMRRGTEYASLPKEAIQRPSPRDIARFDGSGGLGFRIEFDLGSAKEFNSVFVLYTNLATDGGNTLVVYAKSSSDVFTSPDWSSNSFEFGDNTTFDRFGRSHIAAYLNNQKGTTAYRYVGIEIVSNDDPFDIGRVMFCNALYKSPAYAWNVQSEDSGSLIESAGSLWARTGRKSRSVQWQYPALTDTQAYETLGSIENNLREPVVFSLTSIDDAAGGGNVSDDRVTDWTWYGYLNETSSQHVLPDTHLRSFEIQEIERP